MYNLITDESWLTAMHTLNLIIGELWLIAECKSISKHEKLQKVNPNQKYLSQYNHIMYMMTKKMKHIIKKYFWIWK